MIFFFFLGDGDGISMISDYFSFFGLEDWIDSFLSKDMMESLFFSLSKISRGINLYILLLDLSLSMMELRIVLVFSLI